MLELAIDHQVPFDRRVLAAVLLSEIVILIAVLLLPFRTVLFLLGTVMGIPFVLLLPAYPQILFPLMAVATALDNSGQLISDTKLLPKFPVSLTVFHLVGGGAILFCAAHAFLKGRTRFPRIDLTIPLICYLFIVGLSVSYSPNKLEGFVHFIRLCALSVLVFVTVYLVETKRTVTWTILSVIVCGVGTAGLGLFQTFTQGYFLPASFVLEVGANISRAAGTFLNPNTFATFLMVAVVLAATLLVGLRLSWWKQGLLFAAITVLLAALVATFSRANWVATAVGILFVLWFSRKLKLAFVVLLILGMIIGVASAISSNFADLVLGRFTSIFNLFTQFSSFTRVSSSARVYFIMGAFSMFLSHPFLGIGARGFPVLFDQYKPPQFPIWLPTRESHTLPATIIAEFGLIGLCVALWLMVVVLRAGIRSLRTITDPYLRTIQIGLVCVFIGQQVSMLFTADIENNFLWIMVGMLYAVDQISRRSQERGAGLGP